MGQERKRVAFQQSCKEITEYGCLKMGKGGEGKSVFPRRGQRQESRKAQVFGMQWGRRFVSDQDGGKEGGDIARTQFGTPVLTLRRLYLPKTTACG